MAESSCEEALNKLGELGTNIKMKSLPYEATDAFDPAGICWDLVDFEPTELPPWRKDGAGENISKMIDDIVNFQLEWEKKETTTSSEVIKSVKRTMTLSFIHRLNVEENTGTQTEAETEECMIHFENRQHDEERSQNERETDNLIQAWTYLLSLTQRELDNDPETFGILDMEACIQETHRLLMKDIIDETSHTQPGEFSTNIRKTSYKGEDYEYPKHDITEEWEGIISTCLDQYNGLIKGIKCKESRRDRALTLFKYTAWLLLELLTEHPFGDGNGRLFRLLASYTLNMISPFPSPIYNIFGEETKREDYVDALVSARKHPKRHPCDLAALLIESNWRAWRSFLGELQHT